MITPIDYVDLLFRVPILFGMVAALKRMTSFKEHNPTVVCNFILVFADFVFIFMQTAHDYAAKFAEFETFSDTVMTVYLYLSNIRYWVQMYVFCLISLLHLIAIYAPGYYRNFNQKRTAAFIVVPCICTVVHDTLYYTLCNCLYYQIPGYYLAIRKEKQSVEDKFEIFDAWLKGTMIILLIGTDLAIIVKLYKMRATKKANKSTMSMSKPAQSMASPSAVVMVEATSMRTFEKQKRNVGKKVSIRRIQIDVDIRLALAFTYVSLETILMTFFFKHLALIPYSILPYAILFMSTFELAKCTVYVLIVTQK